MDGQTHLVFGISTAAITASFFIGRPEMSVTSAAIFTGMAALGSLMPDIDSEESLIGRKLFTLSFFVNKLFGHRTYTHDIFLIGILAFLFAGKNIFTLGFFFGYLGHLFLDALTIAGIPCFYLFQTCISKKKKRHRYAGNIHLLPYLFRMESGGFISKVFTYVLITGFTFIRVKVGGFV